ncbi:spore germination protein [Capillibacterium thermochitinicola]|uniref:Spore germination protein n=1 Tax=Capillibacterium thermochitinicola TaxID=2699427 RepID=A0A8J6LMB0_9FIRM|nr:spore germination protein [Capillibacterium thermochitinicola]MBA2133519.1 spore germination protein [Capillibacterium thermochitinicola]
MKKRTFRRPRPVAELRKDKDKEEKQCSGVQGGQEEGPPLASDLAANIAYLKERIGASNDVVFREFVIPLPQPARAVLVFVDGLVSGQTINEYILLTLTAFEGTDADWALDRRNLAEKVKEHILSIGEVSVQNQWAPVITAILSGESALFLEGEDRVLICNTRGWEHRGIDEPPTEAAVRGPRVGFSEVLRTNTAQVRRWIRDPDLRIKGIKVGKRTQTDVAIVFLESVANPDLVAEVEKRLQRIDIDGVLESAYLQEYIEDQPYSLFPTLQVTERVDRVVAALLDGKVAVLVDNTPFALLMPVTFWQLYYSAEDYYHRWPLSILIRMIRFLAFFFSLYLPAIFIALAVHNPELIPFNLAIKIAGTREGIPFPVFLETLFMELAIEILREASIRLPGPFGQTIGIVGGFILGDTAVRAGLISPIMTIIVALTAICSFTAPSFGVAITMRILRFPLMLIGQVGGLYGLSIATILLLINMAGIRSFGVPFLSPVVPLNLSDLKDFLFVAPRWAMIKRPLINEPIDIRREGSKARNWREALLYPPSRRPRGGKQEE